MKHPTRLFSHFLLCLSLSATAVSADAAVLYVSPAQGNDSNPGTELLPLRTITAALAIATAGDTVELAAGLYAETVTFPRSGTADQPITLRGALDSDGVRLSTIDPGVQLDPQNWVRAEAIGPDVYQYTGQVPFAIAQLVVNGKQIAPLHHRAGYVESQSERLYSAMEILAWEPDHHITLAPYQETLPFWDIMGAIYYVAEPAASQQIGQLYLRFANGSDPANATICAYPAQATVKLQNVGFIELENLNIAASEIGVEIRGQNATGNSVSNSAIYYGTARLTATRGASHASISGNTFEMRFYGTAPGAWAGGTDAASAAKNFVYTYYKYWASAHSISDDRSLALHSCHNITVSNNTIDGGLSGISLIDAAQVSIEGNTVKNHSSVGVIVRDQSSEIYIDGNDFANNSIQIRLHNLNYGWHRGIYIVRNLSLLPEQLGTHLFCHVAANMAPIGAVYSPEVYILHNSFIGGYRGIALPTAQHVADGLNEFFIINNLFAVDGPVFSGLQAYLTRGLGIGVFDYNLILEPANLTTLTAPWFGSHVLIKNAEPLSPEHLPASGWQRQSGAHPASLPYLTGRRADDFSFITDNYYLSESPDIGSAQLPSPCEPTSNAHE